MSKTLYPLTFLLALAGGLAGGAVSGWLFTGEPAFAAKASDHAKILRAEKFELVDSGGHGHASLEMQPDGNPALILFDADHNVHAVLDMTGGGNPQLFLSDTKRKMRTIFGLANDGSPFLHLKDANRQVIGSAP